jgi:uncharacterized protein YneF (UPF0154 family)
MSISVPLPLMIVVYVIATIVVIIVAETIYTIAKSIIKNQQKAKPPLSSTTDDPRVEL